MNRQSMFADEGSVLKGFFFIAPDYKYWSPALMRSLNNRAGDACFSAVVLGRLEYDYVKSIDDSSIASVFHLDELERAWLSTPCKSDRLEYYEQLLGPGALRRVLAGDRHVAPGFATGGILPDTPLRRACRDFEAQKRYVVGAVDFLFEHFRRTSPDFAFFSSVADSFSTAAEVVCRFLNIPLLSAYHTGIGKLCVIDELYEGIYSVVQRDFENALTNGNLDREYYDCACQYIRDFRDRPEPPEYKTFSDALDRKLMPGIDLLALVWRTISRRAPESLQHAYPASLLLNQFATQVKQFLVMRSQGFKKLADLKGEKFAFYPLHYDPEGSTMIWAPMHSNQIPVIEALSKSLPLNMTLAIKEHPAMIGRRPSDFYRQLRRLPGVVVISPFEDTFSLISRSEITCTITGTAGWEALLLKRPVLCVGPARVRAVGEGVVYCPDLSALAEGIQDALLMPPADDERVALFLACVMRNSFEFSQYIYKERLESPDGLDKHAAVVELLAEKLMTFLAKRAQFSNASAALTV